MFSIFLQLLEFIIIIRVIISWMPVDQNKAWVQLVFGMTEPIMAPVRKLTGMRNTGVDFSPIVIILLINVLLYFVQ